MACGGVLWALPWVGFWEWCFEAPNRAGRGRGQMILITDRPNKTAVCVDAEIELMAGAV